MNVRRPVLITLSLLGLLSIVGCTETDPLPFELTSRENPESAVLSISDVVSEESDGVMLVCPYASVRGLAEASGRERSQFKVQDAQLPGDDEGEFALLRVDGDAVSFLRTYRRTPVDLCGAGPTSGTEFARDEQLALASTDGGKTWTLGTTPLPGGD